MSLFKPKFVLLLAACAWFPTLAASGCSGAEFEADGAVAGSKSTAGTANLGGSNNGTGGSGSGATVGTACDGPEDCDDGDECTVDRCNADGTCDAAPKCSGTENCCDGDCAECCSDADCDDDVACTVNTCFAGQCMYVPDDSSCDATQYCAAGDGCRARQACGILTNDDVEKTCDDGNACTTDSCASNLCQHDFCDQSKHELCCEDGCAAECCSDSQCDKDDDPCTVGSCNGGKCSQVPLCGEGKECCESADGKTATCGSCCSASECDDKVGCTLDQCGGGQCSNTPVADRCNTGYRCDIMQGCVKAPCTTASDCQPGACQTSPTCSNGTCTFEGCTGGTKCCANAGCALCCDDKECDDNIACTVDSCGATGCTHTPDSSLCATGLACDGKLGCIQCKTDENCADNLACTTDTCNQQTNTCTHTSTCAKGTFCTIYGCSVCLSDSDCQGGVVTNIIEPGGCNVSTCVKGQCKTSTVDCGEQICCPPFGCQLRCGIDTTQ